MSQTDDWNHMVLVESNSSCDNIARRAPPPQSLTLSHVTVVQERLQLEKVNRWRGPRTKWSPFLKRTCGIWGGNGFAAKQSIIRNYNNLTLEDGSFHFIRKVTLSCLTAWSWWGGASGSRDSDYETDRWGLVWMRSDCCHLVNVFATLQNAVSSKFKIILSNLVIILKVVSLSWSRFQTWQTEMQQKYII